MLIDTHCHLNDPSAFPDAAAEIAAAKAKGVERIIVVGVKPDEWAETVRLAESHEELFCILGWHPNYTADYSPDRLQELETLLQRPKTLALGEIGLDYHWDYSPPEVQRRALLDQLGLAQKLEMPVVFHAREAYSDLLDVLEARPKRPYLLHCFAGSQQDAQRGAELGCYFGVDGPVTYKKAEDLRQILRRLPPDRLVVETDAPYLTPVPYRGKPNRPAYIPEIVAGLAAALGISPEECASVTTINAKRFFGSSL